MARTQQEIKEQKKRAGSIFVILLLLLVGFVAGVMVFQFGWGNVTPANGALYVPPTPTVTPAVGATSPATDTPSLSTKDQAGVITEKSVESSYWTWLFASWAGVAIYLLSMAARRFYKIEDDPESDFIGYTPWYIINFVRAPLLAMVTLWILTNININLGPEGSPGAAANFKELPAIVLTAMAFILGLYTRVSQKQLDIITKAIFPKAWLMAEDKFEVIGPDIILLKDKFTFRTDPVSDVLWSASPGTIDPETGVYTAPGTESEDGMTVIVRASSRSDPSKTNHKVVTLKLFQINGPTEADSGESITLNLSSKVIEEFTSDISKSVGWSSSDATTTSDDEKKTIATATVTSTPPPETIKVTAKLVYNKKSYTAEKSIKIKSVSK